MADLMLPPTLERLLREHDRRLAELERAVRVPAQTALLTTAESTTATSYGDLATAGPQVSVTVAEGQQYLVVVSATITGSGLMSIEVTGAGTVTPSDNYAALADLDGVSGTPRVRSERTTLFAAGAAGERIFTARYRALTGTATFGFRRVTVIPL